MYTEFDDFGRLSPRRECGITTRTDKFSKQAMHADMIMNSDMVAHFAEDLFQHSWIFTVNKSEIPFITSDNPITPIQQDFNRGFAGAGLKSPGVVVFFPLSPQVAIMMFEKQYGFERLDRMCDVCTNSEEIKQYNIATLSNAIRVIISNTADLTCYQEYTREHPEIREKELSLFIGGKEYKY